MKIKDQWFGFSPVGDASRTATLNPRRLKVERRRNLTAWYTIKPQIPNTESLPVTLWEGKAYNRFDAISPDFKSRAGKQRSDELFRTFVSQSG